MITKVKTIWKYGIVWSDNQDELNVFAKDCYNVKYCGLTKNLPQRIAEEVAEIHPNYSDYNDNCMMTLYKTYGKSKGTEMPQLAIESLKPKNNSSSKMSYILIWKIC